MLVNIIFLLLNVMYEKEARRQGLKGRGSIGPPLPGR